MNQEDTTEYCSANTVDMKRLSSIMANLEKRKIKFSGRRDSDPERFLIEFEEFGEFLGISEMELYKVIPTVLSNEALEWFRLERNNFSNFRQFKEAFCKQYGMLDIQTQLLKDVFDRSQAIDESITSFLINVRVIFNRFDPRLPLEMELDITHKNLNPQYLEFITRSTFSTFAELLALGKEVEANIKAMKDYKSSSK